MTYKPVPTKEGYAIFKHSSLPADKECRTWYMLVGDFTSGRRPLVTLHGGPGSRHNMLRPCWDEYPATTGTPVVSYDQIGCGNSTRLPETKGNQSFWTPALFVAELDNLLRHLGIRDNFDLLGHSWGSKLAASYAISKEAKDSGLNKIVLGSGTCDQKDFIKGITDWIEAQDQKTQDIIYKAFETGRDDNDAYQLVLWEFLKKAISPSIPRPKPGQRIVEVFVPDDTVYATMLGKDPLHGHMGNLRTFDMTESCKTIKQPVLLVSGELENPRGPQPFFDGIPKVKWYVVSGSAHSAATDQPEKYRNVVWNFLKDK